MLVNIAHNDSLYLLVAYKVIELAIDLEVGHIEQGLTTYSIKRDPGGPPGTHKLLSERSLPLGESTDPLGL